jgi:hypothetical protein
MMHMPGIASLEHQESWELGLGKLVITARYSTTYQAVPGQTMDTTCKPVPAGADRQPKLNLPLMANMEADIWSAFEKVHLRRARRQWKKMKNKKKEQEGVATKLVRGGKQNQLQTPAVLNHHNTADHCHVVKPNKHPVAKFPAKTVPPPYKGNPSLVYKVIHSRGGRAKDPKRIQCFSTPRFPNTSY